MKRAVVALVLVLAGCADDGGGPGDTRAPIVDPTTPSTTEPTPPTTTALPDTESIAGVDIQLRQVATLELPTDLAVRPGVDDRLFVTERVGRVRQLALAGDGSAELDPEALVDITGETTTDSERGLLGLAFSPDGERLYISYTDLDGNNRVDEYQVGPEGVVPGSRRAVLSVDHPFPNHDGGHIAFGPDGLLYLGLGDGGGAGDPLEAGQDVGQLLASIIRIDPAGVDGEGYAVPRDNPFVGTEGARPELWLKGVRNPWRFSFDRQTGDLWIGDVGQNEVEEVDWLPAGEDGTGAGRGANLGWNLMEGDQEFAGSAPSDHTPPIHTYRHEDGNCSVTGGYVYRGTALPDLVGAYLYGDYCVSEVRALLARDGEVVEDRALDPGYGPNTLVSFGEGPDGELYVLSFGGQLSRIEPA
jgi:glucose/arabinose dehydrogenase